MSPERLSAERQWHKQAIAILAQEQRIGDAGLREASRPKYTAVAAAARLGIGARIVAAAGQPVVEAERRALRMVGKPLNVMRTTKAG